MLIWHKIHVGSSIPVHHFMERVLYIHPINPKFMDNTEWSLGIYRERQNLKEESCTWTKQVPPKTFIFLLYMNGGVWMCKKLIQAFDKSRSDNSNYRLKWCNHIYCESNYKNEYKNFLIRPYLLFSILASFTRSGYPIPSSSTNPRMDLETSRLNFILNLSYIPHKNISG